MPRMSALIKYFGKRSENFGKPLWEIVMNLKDFGKGRLVQRTKYTEIYPNEPTYYRIIRVEPHSIEQPPGRMVGNLWVEATFRGRKYDDPLNLGSVAFLDDFQLIAKHEEESFCNRGTKHLEPTAILPRTAPFPPLWRELIIRERMQKNLPVTDCDLEVELMYNFDNNYLKRVANENEEPTLRITPVHTTPRHEDMYKGVIFDRAEASKFYEKIHNSRKYQQQSQG